ncbi:MAG: Asp-tRNA(Asn)/Glu-tRNA(Gln) amidotransferase GatCAB subunit B, partial [Pedobacter sp.]
EVKNLNSMRNVRRAMDFEFGRQVEVIENGGKIIQSTLNFDADKGTTSPMRTKEEANDYRYFADPDLQPIFISDDWLAEITSTMPALPNEISKQMVTEFGITKADAALFAEDLDLLNYFNEALPIVNTKKTLINWLIGPVRAVLSEKGITINNYKVKPEQLAAAINLVDDKKLTQQIAIQQLLPAIETEQNANVTTLAQSLNLLISENSDELGAFVDEVLAKYPQQVEAYKKGKKGVLGLFVGDVMKLAKGKADAKKLNELILEKLK